MDKSLYQSQHIKTRTHTHRHTQFLGTFVEWIQIQKKKPIEN